MTNEQLAILLRTYHQRVAEELDSLEVLLEGLESNGATLARELESWDKRTGLCIKLVGMINENWEQRPTGAFAALAGLRDLAADLDEAVETLTGGM